MGAGGLHGPFRNGPTTWHAHGQTYINERHVGVPVAATHYVAQLRGWLPKPIGALNWFSVDDASFSAHAPFHACATRVPRAYSNAAGSADAFSFESAFWVFNMVANFAYYRHTQVAPIVLAKVHEYERRFLEAVRTRRARAPPRAAYAALRGLQLGRAMPHCPCARVTTCLACAQVEADDQRALALWPTDPSAAVELLTASAEARGNGLVKDWLGLYQRLFMDFRDGQVPRGVRAGYAQDWYDRIASETGDKYLVPAHARSEADERKLAILHRYER